MTLSRQTQKVFAGNANADMLAVFGTMKTGTPQYSTNLSTLQSNAYSEGWSEAILNDKAPYLEEMNAVQYGLSYQIAYLLQQGISEWDANTIYKTNSLVQVVENNELVIKRSKVDNNLGNLTNNTSYWEDYFSATILGNFANISLTNTTPTISFATALNNAGIRTVIETYSNDAAGYRIWTDGYCEQWGYTNESAPIEITFTKEFADTNYNIMLTVDSTRDSNLTDSAICYLVSRNRKETKKMKIIVVGRNFSSGYNARCYWKVSGYLAEGEY